MASNINWSYTAVNNLRQCNRKYYFANILAHFGRKDSFRRKAYELKQMQTISMWQGSVVDKILETEVIPAIKNRSKLNFEYFANKAVELAQKRFRFSENKKYLDSAINKSDSGDEYCILDIHEIKVKYEKDVIEHAYKQIKEAVLNLTQVNMPDGKTTLIEYLRTADLLLPNVQNWMITIENALVKPQIDLILYHKWKPVVVDWKVSESPYNDYSKQLTIAGLVVYQKRIEKSLKENKAPYLHNEIKLYEINLALKLVREYEFTEESANDMIDYIYLTSSDISLLKRELENETLSAKDFDVTNNNNTCKYCNFRTLCSHLIINNYKYDETIYLQSI